MNLLRFPQFNIFNLILTNEMLRYVCGKNNSNIILVNKKSLEVAYNNFKAYLFLAFLPCLTKVIRQLTISIITRNTAKTQLIT